LLEVVMHRVDSRTYVGQPSETVTLTTTLGGGGQVSVIVNGQDIGAVRRFPLPAGAGDRLKFQIALLGPLGSTCVVGISPVDGSIDGDFLMCQAHNPAPVSFYTCSVAAMPALTALARAKGLQPAPGAKKAGKKKKTAKSGAKKGGS
jgi:hypothetical protein